MATAEMNTEGDQTESMLPPVEEDSPVLNDTSASLNFSELTPLQFGISEQSFTPVSSPKSKDKSRLAQMKARRRSGVGARGSPETNSLIRFMARQRMKTPPTFQTPELARSSPLLPRVASMLRQKMASFQSLMDVEESEVCDPMPKQDSSNTGGCIKTRDYLSDRSSHDGGKENNPPMMTAMPSKRRRLGPIDGCEVEIREASTPIFHLSLKKQKEEEPVMQVVTQGPLSSTETVEQVQAVLISPTFHFDLELQTCSPARNQQDDIFELQSPRRPPPDDSAAASPARHAPALHIPSFPSLLEMNPTGEDDSTGTSVKKKKRVCFGGPLSPEFFDKNLPPSTPLQKGSEPARVPTPGGIFQPRSVLKTPQRSESQTSAPQPDPSSPTGFGASPTLAMPRHCRMPSVGEDSDERDEERLIVFPSMEEVDSAWTGNPECTWEVQPLNLNAAFIEESLSQILTESEVHPSTTSQMDEPMPEQERQHEAAAPAQSRDRREKQPRPEHRASSEAEARSGSRKRKPEESQPVKRSTRSAAQTTSGKMKRTAAAMRRWNRDVDRSLYGSRAYASKNPTLSPINERLALIGRSQAAPHIPCTSSTAPNHETPWNPEMANGALAPGELTVTNALENSPEDSVTSTNSFKKMATKRVRGRGLKKRTVSVSHDTLLSEETLDPTGGETEEHGDGQTTPNLEASSETPLNRTLPEQGEPNTEHKAHISADTLCTDSDGNLECHGSPAAATSGCPPSGGEPDNTLSQSAERTAMTVKESAVNVSELQEQGRGDHAAAIQWDDIGSSSETQEEVGGAGLHLASWQADFNFEDVFKPVASRNQVRSVRRSLRNQSNAEHSGAGLAWLAWTSPESMKESRRKTRVRRLSAVLAIQLSLPEETQDKCSVRL
ncbi:cell division cycle-associated protein 2 isoform X2 [Pseudoliparis swirei]|uniref:cell division cycle-associated protein 2 isoform X2 n=1 Tax=Pseudoliparis swirei TaxID=2059687 RepID=UPI0024BE90C3|nr:cell division cycle-associated protein 2 isoform X2 [Pseudoliparis swirei]